MSNPSDNYFELYSLPVSFQIDLAELSARHKQLMEKFHPDRFVQSDGLSKKQAAQTAALLNESYSKLKSPLSRAAYLLEMVGEDGKAEEETTSDGAFLMQQMEMREQVDEARNAPDPFFMLDNVRQTAESHQQALFQAFDDCYQKQDFFSAREAWVKLNFYTRLHRQIDSIEEKLEDQ